MPAAESEPIPEKKHPEPQKEIADDETPDETAEEKNPNILFFIITGAISAVVLALFFFLGSMSHKYEEDINFELAKQREKNSSYAEVKKETEDNQNAISELTSENEELQKELFAVSEKVYKAANPQGAENAQPQGGAQNGDPNVYEADYTDVDDNNKQ